MPNIKELFFGRTNVYRIIKGRKPSKRKLFGWKKHAEMWYRFACEQHGVQLGMCVSVDDKKTYLNVVDEIKKCGACGYVSDNVRCVATDVLTNEEDRDA